MATGGARRAIGGPRTLQPCGCLGERLADDVHGSRAGPLSRGRQGVRACASFPSVSRNSNHTNTSCSAHYWREGAGHRQCNTQCHLQKIFCSKRRIAWSAAVTSCPMQTCSGYSVQTLELCNSRLGMAQKHRRRASSHTHYQSSLAKALFARKNVRAFFVARLSHLFCYRWWCAWDRGPPARLRTLETVAW